MKRLVALALSVLMMFSFVACGENDSSDSKKDTSTFDSKQESTGGKSGFQIEESQIENLGKPKREYDFTVDQIISVIDKKIASKKMQLLSDQIPRIQDYKSDSMGNVDENQYSLGKGILLSIYSDKDNKKTTGFLFFMDTSNATKESLNYYSACADAVIQYLDAENADKIEKQLGLSNISNNGSTRADEEKSTFFYDVRDGTNSLQIDPTGK